MRRSSFLRPPGAVEYTARVSLVAQNYPRLSAYLSRLPDGVLSYPRHLVKCSLLRGLISECPAGGDSSGLPEEVRLLLGSPPPPSVWIPEVQFVAAHSPSWTCTNSKPKTCCSEPIGPIASSRSLGCVVLSQRWRLRACRCAEPARAGVSSTKALPSTPTSRTQRSSHAPASAASVPEPSPSLGRDGLQGGTGSFEWQKPTCRGAAFFRRPRPGPRQLGVSAEGPAAGSTSRLMFLASSISR